MAILRDITARLGLQLDKGSFVQADKTIGGLTNQLSALSSIVISAGAAFAFGKIVELGSDAGETLSTLNAVFKDNAGEVLSWAESFSEATGRSQFEMRELATTLGATINPLMDRNTKAAAEMSNGLAAVAVDLGSFFNAADSDVLTALRSGIIGETEPLKRFGIVMLDATLEAFALSQGITKSFKSMTIAEKTTLRYNFILSQTIDAQGDAARTADKWANASKAVAGAFKDLGTQIGLSVIPFVERIAVATRTAVQGFLEWTKGTKILETAMLLLGIIGAKVALGLIIAWAPVIFPILKAALVFAILALVVEDFLTFLEGGDSVIGRFIDSIFGPGSAAEAADNLKLAWEGLAQFWDTVVAPAMDDLIVLLGKAGKAVEEFFDPLGKWIDSNSKKLKVLLGVLKLIFPLIRFMAAALGALGALRVIGGEVGEALKQLGRERRGDLEEGIGLMSGGAQRTRSGVTRTGTDALAADSLLSSSPALASFQPPPASVSSTVNNSVTVNAGNATASDASRIAEVSSEAINRQARRTRAATTQRAE